MESDDDLLSDELSYEKGTELLHGLEQLLASPGWTYYSNLVKQQELMRYNQVVLTPLQRLDDALAVEFMKGEIAMARTLQRLPETIIEQTKEALAELRRRQEQQPNEGDQE